MAESFNETSHRLGSAHRKDAPSARRKKTLKVLIVGPVAGGSLPVARSVAAAFEILGYDCFFLDYSGFADQFRRAGAADVQQRAAFVEMLKKALLDRINRNKPDVVLGIAQSPLSDGRLLAGIRNSGVITAYWFVEDFRVRTYWKQIARNFDIFFSIQAEDFRNALAEQGLKNHYYLPVAFDANSHTLPDRSAPGMEISFMGAPYPNRVRIFERLGRLGIKIYGEGWDRYRVPGVVAGAGRIAEPEARSIYVNTKVNLNIHSSPDPFAIGGGDFVNPRTFELAGMGCFQLTDNRELLAPLYAEDEIVRFAEESELVEKIEYYLKHEDERKEIARNARRRTLRDHLYEHRVVAMMNGFEKLAG